MKVTYIAPEDDAEKIVAFGVSFQAGIPMEVDDERALSKLRNNPCFRMDQRLEEKPLDGRTKAAREAKAAAQGN